MARKLTATEEKKVRQTEFLRLVRGIPGKVLPLSIRAACDRVEISRQTYNVWKRDPEFLAAFHEATEDGADLIEDEAVRRAVEGCTEPVYQGGELVGHKQVYSDRLMEKLLDGYRPAKYSRNPNIQINNTNTASTEITDEQLARAMALLLAEAKHKVIEAT